MWSVNHCQVGEMWSVNHCQVGEMWSVNYYTGPLLISHWLEYTIQGKKKKTKLDK